MTDEIEKLADWMRRERTKRRWSTDELARRTRQAAFDQDGHLLKLSQQSISNFEQGGAKRVPSWIKNVSYAFRVEEIEPEAPDAEDMVVYVERLPTYAGAGGGGTGEGSSEKVPIARAILEYELKAEARDIMEVMLEGNSMSPDFESGDRVLVDRRKVSIAQPGAFCLWDGDGYVVKYLEKVPGSEPAKVRVISRNPIFSTFERLVDEVRIMGRVVWFARKV